MQTTTFLEKKFGQNDQNIAQYVEETFQPEDEILKKVRENQEQGDLPDIQVGGMDVRHLEVLARMINPKKIVEIGTLGGYSATSLMRSLAPHGKLYTFEYDSHHAEVAKKSFEIAGITNQVQIFTGSALKNLPKIENEGPFDLVFIDADKENYPNYLKWAEKNLRVGGVILADNTFAFGHIHETDIHDPELKQRVVALRKFNELLAKHPHFRATILPTGEGLTTAVKVK